MTSNSQSDQVWSSLLLAIFADTGMLKVKCDETWPKCRSCYVRKIQCVYQTPSKPASVIQQDMGEDGLMAELSINEYEILDGWPQSVYLASQQEDATRAALEVEVNNDPINHGLYELVTGISSNTSASTRSALSRSSIQSAGTPVSQVLTDGSTDCFDLPIISSISSYAAIAPPPAARLLPEYHTNLASSPPDPVYASLGTLPPTPTFDVTDLKLLSHYIAKTHTSFVISPPRQRSATAAHLTSMLEYAFSPTAPFLLDNLLALSALDLQTHTNPSSCSAEVARRALTYQSRALTSYLSAIASIASISTTITTSTDDPTLPAALIANSLLLTALTTTPFRQPLSPSSSSSTTTTTYPSATTSPTPQLHILRYLVIWRGIPSIIEHVGLSAITLPSSNPLGLMLYRPSISSFPLPLPPPSFYSSPSNLPPYLASLLTSIPPSSPDWRYRTAYAVTLSCLGALYEKLERRGFSAELGLIVVTWFTYLPKAFVGLCLEGRERALVMLGFWGGFARLVEGEEGGVWWRRGVGGRAIREVLGVLEGRRDSREWEMEGKGEGKGWGWRICEWGGLLGLQEPEEEGGEWEVKEGDRLGVARRLLGDETWVDPRSNGGLGVDGDGEEGKGGLGGFDFGGPREEERGEKENTAVLQRRANELFTREHLMDEEVDRRVDEDVSSPEGVGVGEPVDGLRLRRLAVGEWH